MPGSSVIMMPCNAPAPLAVNGMVYVGCLLQRDHDGPHTITIHWHDGEVPTMPALRDTPRR